MKLGIAVAYLFGAELEPLFDLHLSQIEKCTQIPYFIYCSVNRLTPKQRQRLTQYKQIQAVELPPTELRGMQEHSYYLDRLIRIAVDDGATHVATLHLDSFPIRVGWIEELAARLTDTCVIATVDRINTACLVFGRDFYLSHSPTMLVSEPIQATPGFRNYIQMYNPVRHSGIGYGFAAFAKNLSWYYLPLTSNHNDYGRIYDDMIFHLAGTIRIRPNTPPGTDTTPSLLSRGFIRAAFVGSMFIPWYFRSRLRTRYARWVDHLIDQPNNALERPHHDTVMRDLLQAPDAFIDQLRRHD